MGAASPSGGLLPLVAAAAGTFALTGEDIATRYDRALGGDAGVFTLTGVEVSLNATGALAAETGTFVLAGQDAALERQALLEAGAAAGSCRHPEGAPVRCHTLGVLWCVSTTCSHTVTPTTHHPSPGTTRPARVWSRPR